MLGLGFRIWAGLIVVFVQGFRVSGLKTPTWTLKVGRIIAFYRFWAIVLPTFGGLGNHSLTH